MSSEAHDWLDIADGDLDTVRRSLVPDPEPNIPIAAYHCQQAAEKLMKALLVHAGVAYPRGSGGHDLGRIVEALPANHPLQADARALAPITPWATAFRYPTDDPMTAEPLPTAAEVETVLKAIAEFRGEAAALIGPRPPSEEKGP